jgi:hypothetical protein
VAISKVSYVYVEEGGAAPTCALKTLSPELEDYLDAHVDDLLRRGTKGDGSPPASFRSTDANSRLEALLNGTDQVFLTAAQTLATRLQQEMDKRTKKGFFVALRRVLNGATVAGVLKLDVSDKQAAAIHRTTTSEPDLEAVRELLDVPGQLQKGALYPDPRTQSDVLIGDRLPETSLYFLRAIDAEQIAKPGPATGRVVRAVARVATPPVVAKVVEALEDEKKPTTPESFFRRHKEILPEPERRQVLEQLAHERRPIRRIDPTRYPVFATWSADGITVRGRVKEVHQKVKVRKRDAGGWRIEIDVSEEPRFDTE